RDDARRGPSRRLGRGAPPRARGARGGVRRTPGRFRDGSRGRDRHQGGGSRLRAGRRDPRVPDGVAGVREPHARRREAASLSRTGGRGGHGGGVLGFLLIPLLLAALGILGAVIKVTLVLVASFILAILVIGFGTYYYLRHRFRKYVKEAQRQQAQQGVPQGGPPATPPGTERGYPTTGTKGPGPSLPQ